MVKKERGLSSPLLTGKKMKQIILLISLILTVSGIASAQEWEESYDPNTEISIRGKIAEIIIREHGPVILGISRNDRIYSVITGPRWFIEQEKIEFKTGDEVLVQGAKMFSKRGEIFLLARSIHNINNGKTYSFRDDFSKPCWRGKGRHRIFNSR